MQKLKAFFYEYHFWRERFMFVELKSNITCFDFILFTVIKDTKENKFYGKSVFLLCTDLSLHFQVIPLFMLS